MVKGLENPFFAGFPCHEAIDRHGGGKDNLLDIQRRCRHADIARPINVNLVIQ
ncbi:hypothetical protein D3C80_674860 [compost metagenome]